MPRQRRPVRPRRKPHLPELARTVAAPLRGNLLEAAHAARAAQGHVQGA